jgi:hypothetical protein
MDNFTDKLVLPESDFRTSLKSVLLGVQDKTLRNPLPTYCT